jgi:tetraacyldisaccharide 4'-kinase
MKTPEFWQTKNLFSTALLPLSALYGVAINLKKQLSPHSIEITVPVICVGNVTAGGAGKTPTAIAIAERLKNKNVHTYFLSRGYGGALKGPVLVNPDVHTARDVGDEPLLLARILPTIVAKDRVQGVTFACEKGARLLIMDDGFQNHSIPKILSLLVVDGRYGFGNGQLLPAGPLRETPESAFARAHGIIVIGKNTLSLPTSLPIISATLTPTPAASALRGRNVFAFCGIAHPQKFFDTLALIGATLTGSAAFSDHHCYNERDMETLTKRAKHANAILVTTAKDAVRLRPEWKSLVTVVEVSLIFDKPEQLDALLAPTLKKL